MTSAWKELPDRDDRADGQQIGSDENQLEMFGTASVDSAEQVLSPLAGAANRIDYQEGGKRRHEGLIDVDASARDFLDAGRADSDELRRLEDSIRWLMDESGVPHLPRAATLPPVHGLPPIEAETDDTLLLDPDHLFPPRHSNRRSGGSRGMVKFLLASAVAAPTAYFAAGWLQRSDAPPPSAVVPVAGSFEERIAAATPRRPSSERPRGADEIGGDPPAELTPMRGMLPIGAPSEAPVRSYAVESREVPDRPPEKTPETTAAPADPAPQPDPVAAVAAVSPPRPTPAVAAPALSPQEIALMVERGRVLFESGDVAAARLFFRRAANAGDAAAALAMGATYDPDVLGKHFIRGIGADAAEARMWYEKARALGSPEGPRRIEMLAHR